MKDDSLSVVRGTNVKRFWYFIHGTVLLLQYCGITNSSVWANRLFLPHLRTYFDTKFILPLVATVSNSYYIRFYVYLNAQKFYFLQRKHHRKGIFLLHGITVFEILDGIRNQYCGMTTQPVYCSTLRGTLLDTKTWHCLKIRATTNGKLEVLKYVNFDIVNEIDLLGLQSAGCTSTLNFDREKQQTRVMEWQMCRCRVMLQ